MMTMANRTKQMIFNQLDQTVNSIMRTLKILIMNGVKQTDENFLVV